jgi:FecR protein/Putative zinc-finger
MFLCGGKEKMKHYIEQLSAHLHHELPKEERQLIAEHLLQCEDCRREHDEIKLGVSFASNLPQAEAPNSVWNGIKSELDGKRTPQLSQIPQFSFFTAKGFVAFATALIVTFGLVATVYFGLFQSENKEVAKVQPTPEIIAPNNPNSLEIIPTPTPEIVSNSNQNINVNVPNTNVTPSNISVNQAATNSNLTSTNPIPNVAIQTWKVETISGKTVSEIAVGETLITDAASRARVQVANIGQVEIAPNSRVKLLKTNEKEHRLSLETGILKAKIDAPPRLFIVDTPTAVAVDLGCEYTLEVDKSGNSKLHVTSGFVALERGGRESIVPAGAMALTKKGKGLGTPFFDDVSKDFQAAVQKFDFENGGTESLNKILSEARSYDTLTLWHLLSRTQKEEREKVFAALLGFVKLPEGVTKDGVLKLNKKMLEQWRKDMESLWFE